MSDQGSVISIAQQLLDSLYASGDLSVDQHTGLSIGLERARKLEAERDQWRSIRADETKELRRIAESAGVIFESSRDQDGFEHWAWRYGTEYHPGSVAEGGAAFGAIRWICTHMRKLEQEHTRLRTDLEGVRATLAQSRRALIAERAARMNVESQLGQTHELLAILRDAAAPAAVILYNLTQLPLQDERMKQTIQQTLAPLDAALAATKASGE